jgi:hypothetical protein
MNLSTNCPEETTTMYYFEDPGLARLAHFLSDREYRPLYLSRLPPDQMRRHDRGQRKHDRGRRDRGHR